MKFNNKAIGESKIPQAFFPFGKKSQGNTFWIIIAAIIALVVVVLVIWWFRGGGGKAFGEVEKKIDSLGDCDKDGIANMFDKCPCTAVGGEENPEAEGCPLGTPANPETSCCPQK